MTFARGLITMTYPITLRKKALQSLEQGISVRTAAKLYLFKLAQTTLRHVLMKGLRIP